MKKYLSALLVLALLCACAAPAREGIVPASVTPAEPALTAEAESPVPAETAQADADQTTADAIAQAIVASQPDPEGYEARLGEVSGETPDGGLAFYLELYGVDWDVVSDAAIYTVGGVDAREIAVLDLYHGPGAYDTASTAEALENYRQDRLADFVGYVPEQAAIVEKGQAVESEGWAALLLCEDMAAAREIFEALAGTESGPSPAPTPVPSLTTAPETAPPPTPEPTSTATPDARYKKDARGYLPFLPPNEVDMTLYDTSAIRSAYASGDEAGLSEKDAAILEKCREILTACVTEGMTDFEKELALHDWIVENVAYDQSVHDPQTPEGLPDNKVPYGALVGGYGICLGYATSFQLLMDLAGVECLTVVGASGWSRTDHAWNMVKLDGEWYGVDVTWDDQTLIDPSAFSQKELSRRHHSSFNVTSDELRRTNHQWDYDSVPEAAGTRFHWGGVGEKPQ